MVQKNLQNRNRLIVLENEFMVTGGRIGWEFGTNMSTLLYLKQTDNQGFPGGSVVKNPPANARDTGSIPDPGRAHMPLSN